MILCKFVALFFFDFRERRQQHVQMIRDKKTMENKVSVLMNLYRIPVFLELDLWNIFFRVIFRAVSKMVIGLVLRFRIIGLDCPDSYAQIFYTGRFFNSFMTEFPVI